MAGILQKINTVAHNRTTYKVGLLQAKAYRILKSHTAAGLLKYKVSTVEWAMLGLLNDERKGIRASSIAKDLGVEAPFVTSLFASLREKGLVEARSDEKDSRAKVLFLSEEGVRFVGKVEKEMRAHMKPLLKDVSFSEVASYISVLEKLIINY